MRDHSDVVEPPSIVQQETPNTYDSHLRKTFYPDLTRDQWNDWKWQLRNRIRTPAQLSRIFKLSEDEKKSFENTGHPLPLSITPYYASLMDLNDPHDPLRRCMVPTILESIKGCGEDADPLCEETQSPLPTLVHRYPDRVLFLTTNQCSSYCRYCTRSRTVGESEETRKYNKTSWLKNIAYIRDHTEVRDVLLSGGDPLMLDTENLEWLLDKIRAIDHVEIIRIGTKIPIVLPQRIVEPLVNTLKKYHPLYMSIHCTHPNELTVESRASLNLLADACIPLGSQTVLLKGINDDTLVFKKLLHELLKCRVRPYYLYQCDPIIGSGHFKADVVKGLQIMSDTRGYTSGYAVPTYVIDTPGGKIPVLGNVVDADDQYVYLRNFRGDVYKYPDGSLKGQQHGRPAGCV